VLPTSSKKVSIGNLVNIQFKQKLLPFIQESSAEISSKNVFVSIYNKELEKSKIIGNDINKIWVFEIESISEGKAIGSLTIVANNEQTFDLIKQAIPVLQSIKFSDIDTLLTEIDPITGYTEHPDPGIKDSESPGSGGPPPPPGSGGPPPPPGSGGPPPPPGSGGPPPPPGSGGPPPPPG
jgi:hypothetical protein